MPIKIEKRDSQTAKTDKRVCLVTVEYHGLFRNGGMGTANTGLARALARSGFDVTVAYANSDAEGPRVKVRDFAVARDEEATHRVSLDFVPTDPAAPASFDDPRSASLCVYKYLRDKTFDIVLFNDNGGLGFYSIAAKRTGQFPNAPFMIVVAHGPSSWVREINAQRYVLTTEILVDFMERRAVETADMLISPSRYLIDWMSSKSWKLPDHALVLQNVIPLPVTAPRHRRRDPPRAPTELVFFGRQEIRKGLQLFCDAIDTLDAEMDLRDITITFLGKFGRLSGLHSGVYIAERSRRWEANTRILTTFDQQEALQYLHRSGAVAVIPSLAENSPCVVSECLQLGLPFLASDAGGTRELVAAQDWERCLFALDSGGLTHALRGTLEDGPHGAQPSISPRQVEQMWVDLLATTAPRSSAISTDEHVVSVCLARDDAWILAWESSVARLDYPKIEVVWVDVERAADSRPGGRNRAAARNLAAARAEGEYLLFVDEASADLKPECLRDMVTAARRTGADIVTCLCEPPSQWPHRRQSSGQRCFPVGAVIEAGPIENGFGENVILVRAEAFRAGPKFDENCDEQMLDWTYLATASLEGLSLEVVPARLYRSVDRPSARFRVPDNTSGRRSVLQAYASHPASFLWKALETHSEVGALAAERLNLLLQKFDGAAQALAHRLSNLDPEGEEAHKLFFEYCVQRRRIELATDFATWNRLAYLAAGLPVSSGPADSREALVGARIAIEPRALDLAAALRACMRPIAPMKPQAVDRSEDRLASHPIDAEARLLQMPGGCPAQARSIRVTARVSPPSLACAKAAIAVVELGGTLVVTAGEDLKIVGGAWSGWVEPDGAGALNLELALRPNSEPQDLYFIAKTENANRGLMHTIDYIHAEATIGGVDGARSSVRRATRSWPIPEQVLADAEVLTDVSDFPVPVLGRKKGLMTHPVPGRTLLVRLKNAAPPGALGMRCSVSLENEQARPVDFGVWIAPAEMNSPTEVSLMQSAAFSGWLTVDKPLQAFGLTVLMEKKTETLRDLILAVKVTDGGVVHFCHASWREMEILLGAAPPTESRASVKRKPTASERVEPAATRPTNVPPTGLTQQPARSSQRKIFGKRAYFICAGPRTGSNLIARTLRDTGVAGAPFEYFSAEMKNDPSMLEEIGVTKDVANPPDWAERLPMIVKRGTTPNGVFGATLHWSHLPQLLVAIDAPARDKDELVKAGPGRILNHFPDLRLVSIRRENMVAQAISHYFARKTGNWQNLMKHAAPDPGARQALPFDFDAIDQLRRAAKYEYSMWDRILPAFGDRVHSVTYEQMDADFETILTDVLAFIGAEPTPGYVPRRFLRRQADQISGDWERRYREMAELPVSSPMA